MLHHSQRAENTSNSPPYVRQPFRRQSSSAGTPTIRSYHNADFEKHELPEYCQDGQSQRMAGLGVANVKNLPNLPDLPDLDKRGRTEITDNLRFTRKHVASNPSAESRESLYSGSTAIQDSPQLSELVDFNSAEIKKKPVVSQSRSSDHRAWPGQTSTNSTSRLRLDCPTEGDILINSWSRFTIPILILALYSTIFSATFLGIAIKKPRWGDRIGTKHHMSFAQATLLSTSISKTIELSFGTVFVALLGQILTRRAVARTAGGTRTGVSIAEMSMRSWITQPGSLLTDWSVLRYTVATVLGVIAIIATLTATFYGTAAEALVSPKLRFGPMEHRVLIGKVSASFANSPYLQQNCETPIPTTIDDPKDRGDTCFQIEHAGAGFRNLQSYISGWGQMVGKGGTAGNLHRRPAPTAMLPNNVMVYGQWINPTNANITKDSKFYQRLVQNITVAMPHANIIDAVSNNPRNHILQPRDLQASPGDLIGEFYVSASVPAPTVNILCAGMSGEELAPLTSPNGSLAPTTSNATVVDDLFRFSDNFGKLRQPRPSFKKVPLPFNTVVNFSQPYGSDSIYMLATPPQNTSTNEHVLCSVKAMQYPNCTTKYHMAEAGGELSVHCGKEDKDNTIPYSNSQPEAPSGIWEKDWKDVGIEWIKAVGLNGGASDANSSIARLVTQMIPAFDKTTHEASLDPSLPSIGEAIGVLVSSTMLLSSQDAPFIHFWNYSDNFPILESPQYAAFNATVKFKDYASGGTQNWQSIFYLVLVAAFLLNSFGLTYLVWRFYVDGQVTDYTDPANLFALAINSPPSTTMRGMCGAGPSDEVLGKKWQVNMDVDVDGGGEDVHESSPSGAGGGGGAGAFGGVKHPHFYIQCPDDEDMESLRSIGPPKPKRKNTVQSMQSLWGGESPAVEQYRRLMGS